MAWTHTGIGSKGWFDLCNIALIGISGNMKVYSELFFIIVRIGLIISFGLGIPVKLASIDRAASYLVNLN